MNYTTGIPESGERQIHRPSPLRKRTLDIPDRNTAREHSERVKAAWNELPAFGDTAPGHGDLSDMIHFMKQFSAGCAIIGIAVLTGTRSLMATSLPADILSQLNTYAEVWTSPSTNGSPGSMPIGNGD